MKTNAIDHIHLNAKGLEKVMDLFTDLTGAESSARLIINEIKES